MSVRSALSKELLKVENRIYFNHGVPYLAYTGFQRFALYILEYLNCKLCTEIISVSNEMKSILKVLVNKKITVINHGSACGIDLNLYKSNSSKSCLIEDNTNILKNDFVVIYVGRPVKRKGFDELILMWSNFFKNKKFKLLLCGCNKKDVSRLLKNIPKNIIPLGFVDKISDIYNCSDLLILPSLHEGLPYAILEAMASKCVVVANNIVGIRSLISEALYKMESFFETIPISKTLFLFAN